MTKHCRKTERGGFTSAPCVARTEDVRKYATEQGIAEEEAVTRGMEEKPREFTDRGSELYAKA